MRNFYFKNHLLCFLTDEEAENIGGEVLTFSYYEKVRGSWKKREEVVTLSTFQSLLDRLSDNLDLIGPHCLTVGPPPKPLQE